MFVSLTLNSLKGGEKPQPKQTHWVLNCMRIFVFGVMSVASITFFKSFDVRKFFIVLVLCSVSYNRIYCNSLWNRGFITDRIALKPNGVQRFLVSTQFSGQNCTIIHRQCYLRKSHKYISFLFSKKSFSTAIYKTNIVNNKEN